MRVPIVLIVSVSLLACAAASENPLRTDRILCQDTRSKTVRAYERCPIGTIEVFAMVNSGGGGYWTPDGRWVGQVASRVDRSPPATQSSQDEDALKALLDRTPNAR